MGNSLSIDIPIKDCIIPMYDSVLEDVLRHRHTHYIFAGGRGSTKSSFVGGICIPLLIMSNPKVNAVCFRKVGNTIATSIYPQVTWGLYQLGVDSLFHIPKTYSTPIVYKPTGQCIYFMGLDDANKVKSIKPKTGYIGVTWFEELDQFAGENELRKVTQSTMRGGQAFWDFRTFNPPISKNNWANEYTETCEVERTMDTLVVRNTYLDVPRSWLGEQFIFEAEELKRINPRAYIHEYGGEAIGTGGDVFPNAQDLTITDEMIQHQFDNIYNGIDWGFALDPFRFVKMHFDKNHLDLYIYAEHSAVKMRNKPIYEQLYNEKKLVRNDELVTADSAEPKSIADFKAFGAFIRPADKGADSVRYGIRWLQGLAHIYIDRRRCPETYKEFVNYEFEQDKDGNFISAYPDADNHSIDATRYAMQKYANRKGN